MRMLIYSNVAQNQTDFLSTKLAFERAEAEGDFIVSYCKPESDVWHEIGVLHFSKAIKYFQYFREKYPAGKIKVQEADLLAELIKAKDAFLKSMTVSATGRALNSLYMFGYTLCLIELLSAEEKPAGKRKYPSKTGILDLFKNTGMRVFHIIGWLRDEPQMADNKREETLQSLLLTLNLLIARYENLVLCRSNIPFVKYMFALIIWDFAPDITVQICRMTLEWLKVARKETGKLISDNISVYHVACGNISAHKFLLHIQDTMDIIYRHITDDDLKQEKVFPLLQAKLKELSNIKLMLLELDRFHRQQSFYAPDTETPSL